MSTVAALLRLVSLVAVAALALAMPATAQDSLGGKISGEDIRRALIWTGYLNALPQGDPVAIFTQAGQDWQKAKKHPVTAQLSGVEVDELMAEAEKKRDSFGWATFEDKSVDFSVGVPTRLVKFVSVHSQQYGTVYEFDGAISFVVGTRYGDVNCATQKSFFDRAIKSKEVYRQSGSNWYAVTQRLDGGWSYGRAVCSRSGVVFAEISIADSMMAEQGVLFSAMAESLRVGRRFNSTAIPKPHLDEPQPIAGDFIAASATREAPAAKLPDTVDKGGKTDAIKRETRQGIDLTVEQAFNKVSAAVYMVKAGERLGSAVAISEHELLTNCHVVKEVAQVTLVHDKAEQKADVVSVNEKADRCVLKAAGTLEKWVTVRPYDDIKVGERAITVGTPQGLELTVAEGIVSSKRALEGRRLVQTTAPVSQGSSGGGLFDAEGHLLGITTFYLAGGQNLNFAVAAEDFSKSDPGKQAAAAP